MNETSIKNLSWLNDTKVYFSYCNVASSNTSRLEAHKEIGDEEPCYSTKNYIFSFIWAGKMLYTKQAQYNEGCAKLNYSLPEV